ncbi:MAG: aspartate-semialdehyde dehydrogenase [Thermoplasmata archaeon]|nr:MAG: aspartate-semialdehyde dehydrogenase [Thermoplasmata archaeon]
MDRIPVGLIGATGAVGQRFVQMLEGHPWFQLEVLAASGKSAGNKYRDAANWILEEEMPEEVGNKQVEQIDSKIFENAGIKLIFSALPADVARSVEPELASSGLFVFSNASAFRMAEDVPLLIADINGDHLALVEQQQKSRPGYIVTNPNCSVIGLASGLKPLADNFGLKSVFVTTYQALSGAGYPGVPSMDIMGNIVPYIHDEEEKVEEECDKILGKFTGEAIEPLQLNVIASCARVGVRNGHLESVLVELETDATIDDIKNAFTEYKGNKDEALPTAPEQLIIVTEDESRPQPVFDSYNGSPERARGMAVTVGRLKLRGSKLRFFLLVHNTIRGASGCSIMNAELAKIRGYI